jgi:PAS domain S-box-containing protein
VNAALQAQESRELFTRLARADESEVPVLVTFAPIEHSDGRLRGLRASVTERSEAPSARTLQTQGELLDMVGAAVIALDPKERISRWNEGARRIFGFHAPEALGHGIDELLLPEMTPEETRGRDGALQRTGSWQGEMTARRKNGAVVTVYLHAVRFAEPRGPVATLIVALDMSEHKATATRLDDTRGYLNAVASNMTEGLLALTPDGRIAYMNEAAEQLVGWRLDEIKGQHVHSTLHYKRLDGSPYPRSECGTADMSLHGKAGAEDDDFLVHRDGRFIHVGYSAAPVRNARGARGSVFILRDLTKRKTKRPDPDRELESALTGAHAAPGVTSPAS